MVGAAQNKLVGINSRFAQNVTVRYSFEGNWMLKQPNIITLEKVVSKVKITQMMQMLLKKENGMRHVLLRIIKLKTVRLVLKCVLVFGRMKIVTSSSSSKGPLSSPSMFSSSEVIPC